MLFAALVTLMDGGDPESETSEMTVLLVRWSEVEPSVTVDDVSLVFVVVSDVTGIFVEFSVVVSVTRLSVVTGDDVTVSSRKDRK